MRDHTARQGTSDRRIKRKDSCSKKCRNKDDLYSEEKREGCGGDFRGDQKRLRTCICGKNAGST